MGPNWTPKVIIEIHVRGLRIIYRIRWRQYVQLARKMTLLKTNGRLLNPYRVVNTFHLFYKNQAIYAVRGRNRCLFSDKYKTHKYNVGRAYSCWMLNLLVRHVTSRLLKVAKRANFLISCNSQNKWLFYKQYQQAGPCFGWLVFLNCPSTPLPAYTPDNRVYAVFPKHHFRISIKLPVMLRFLLLISVMAVFNILNFNFTIFSRLRQNEIPSNETLSLYNTGIGT